MLSLLLNNRARRQRRWPTTHIIFVENAMLDPGARQMDAECNKIVLGWDCYENQVWLLAADEIATGGNRRVTGLNCLMGKGHVFADDHINVFNL